MQTETITLTCLNNLDGFNCTTDSIFSGGEMFISLELLVIIIFILIHFIIRGVLSVKTHKEYQGVNQPEGKEKYRI
jgi:hypothetical protein